MTYPVLVEDRTKETAEEKRRRQARVVGAVAAQTAATLCEGDAVQILRALTTALGLAMAQTGAPVTQILSLLKEEKKLAQEALSEQAELQAHLVSKTAQA